MTTSAAQRFQSRIVDEHIDELRFLLHLRAVRLPLGRGDLLEWLGFDRRLAAHVDGLLLRAPMAWARLAPATRARPSTTALRLSGVVALNSGEEALIDQWLALAATAPALPPTADEVVRWVLPEHAAPLLSLLADDGLTSDLTLALALELAGRLRSNEAVWNQVAARAMAVPAALPLSAHAVARIRADEAHAALWQLAVHPQAGMRTAALCAAPALGRGELTSAGSPLALHDVAAFGAGATMRVALRLPQDAANQQIDGLAASGQWLAFACAVAARGQQRWLPQLASQAAAADVDGAVALLFEVLFGQRAGNKPVRASSPDAPLLLGEPRDSASCLAQLRHGGCAARLVCAEVLRATVPDFEAIDLLAPAWEQLSHPALSRPASTGPEPAR